MLIYDTNIPVLFMVFNRPETTRRVFDAISKAKPQRLYIAADGPRDEQEEKKCDETRAICNAINWECSVQKLFRNNNLGCKRAVSEAITWFFQHEESGIVLEDDCLPADSFFGFCSSLLKRYMHDDRIAHIGGVNFQKGMKRGEASYYFSRLTHVWGWAGWRRVWQHYNAAIPSFPAFEQQGMINNIAGHKPFANNWLHSFRNVYEGITDTWDYQYAYLNLINNGLSIVPNKNLVSNIGVGQASTHTAAHPFQNMPLEEMDELTHPKFFVADTEADIHSQNIEYGIPQEEKKPQKKKRRFRFFR